MSIIKKIQKLIYPLTSRYLSNATLVEGMLKGTDKMFRCLFVENSKYEEIAVEKLFSETPHLLKKWKIWIPNLKSELKKNSDSIDLCIAVLPSNYKTLFDDLCAFKGQVCVRQIIDTSASWEKIFNAFHKKKRQYSNNVERKFGLSYTISHDIDDFDLFYYRMHLPHIRNQFDELAAIDSYDDMKKFFLKGFLLLVVAEGQKIAGALCLIENNKLMFRRSGVLDGNEEFRKKNAQFALYYFNIRYASERGIKQVDTMMSDSFLHNGVYRTKREWGASVYPDDEDGSIVYYFIPDFSPKLATLFEQNPVIIREEDGLYVLAGWHGASAMAVLDKKEMCDKYYSPGLKGMILLAPNGEKTKMLFEIGETPEQ